jgi:hypothetical protein
MSIRRRTYPEVLDNLLTSLTGGVAAEAHPFPPDGANGPPYRHILQQPPARDIISLYGSRDGKPLVFRKNTDYKLMPDQQTLEWQEGAQLPDPGTLVQVNYYGKSSQSVLTDIQTGSVVRTLAETVALEIARLYAQLEVVYQSGFVDTATGRSLDNVVALLGVTRVEGGRPTGEIEFTRSPGSRGIITIPAGTRVITVDGNVEYETTEAVTLLEGQNTLRATARDLEPNEPLAAGSLTVLPVPIAGISSVTNPSPTAISAQAETDDELRTRAKNFLHGSERATLGAIRQAISRQGITADIDEVAGVPGRIEITPHAETLPPELQQRLLDAINDSRPAGVLVTLKGVVAPKKVDLGIRLTTTPGLLQEDLRALQHSVREKIQDYFARLPAREPGSLNRIVGSAMSVPGVEDLRIVRAALAETGEDVLDREAGLLTISGFPTVLGELQIADPSLPTLLSVTVSFPETEAPPDRSAIQTAMTNAASYLNTLNASEAIAEAIRAVSFGKLLRVVPLPNKPGESLEQYDAAVLTGTPPRLPTETSVSPYKLRFVITLESGLSRILATSSDGYALAPFERLSLSSVEVQPEAADA